jgi:two-component system CheB/CheR fusion protein
MSDDPRGADGAKAESVDDDPTFRRLLERLHSEHNFDFREYKHTSLVRRVRARLQQVRVDSFAAYLTYLDRHADEHIALFNTILINVTGFFRDPDSWRVMSDDVIPRLVEDAGSSRSLRIWSAGCSSGEEAYSVAMLVAEHLGDRARDFNVKIYATDVDDEALNTARQGLYRIEDVKDVPTSLLETYFVREGQAFRIRRDIRRWVIFGRHNIAQDPPMSHIDLLICRNVLIYFTADPQDRILARFHYAVREQGFLFLGRAESLLTRSRWFVPYHVKWRVFQRTTVPALTVASAMHRAPHDVAPGVTGAREVAEGGHATGRLERLLEALPSAVMYIDPADNVLAWNPAAESLFDIPGENAMGRKFRDLDISYRIDGLRARVEEVKSSNIPARVDHVAFRRRSGEAVHAEIAIIPIIEAGRLTAVAVYAFDATETAHVKEQMGRLAEQHATAIEELQSTNEELETTNEELQSTNEELETTVEELQAANTELGGLNTEMERRAAEQKRRDDYQIAVLSSLESPVVVLDRAGRVTTWNAAAERLWGIEAEHVTDRPFWALPVGDVAQKLREALRRVGDTGQPELLDDVPFTVPTGEKRSLTVQVTPLRNDGNEMLGVMATVMANVPAA